MEYSRIKMADIPKEPENWIDWFKSIQFFGLLLIIPAWRLIDKYFEYLKTMRTDQITQIVKSALSDELREVKNDIKDIQTQQTRDRDKINQQLVDIYKEIKK